MSTSSPQPRALFWRNLATALLLALLAGTLTHLAARRLSQIYTAETKLLLETQTPIAPDADLYSTALASSQIIESALADLESEQLYPSPDTLRQISSLKLGTWEGRHLLTVSVRSSDPVLAQMSAKALAAALVDWSFDRQARLSVLEPATPESLFRYPRAAGIAVGLITLLVSQALLQRSLRRSYGAPTPPPKTKFSWAQLGSANVESSRDLAAVQQRPQLANAKSILLSSLDEGAGRAEFALRLAQSYAESGKYTLLVDANMHDPQLAALCGLLAGRLESTSLASWLSAPSVNRKVVSLSKFSERLFIVPSFGSSDDAKGLREGFAICLQRWNKEYDITIIHAATTKADSTLATASLCSHTLLLYSKFRERDLRRAGETLLKHDANLVGMVALQAAPESLGVTPRPSQSAVT